MKRPDADVNRETYFQKVFTEVGWIVESTQPGKRSGIA